jgi:hypothetical protein
LALFSLGSGDYDNVNRRFLFTITNQSPYVFGLEETQRWYENLEVDELQEMRVSQFRGYKTSDTDAGVTYSICFRIVTEEDELLQGFAS